MEPFAEVLWVLPMGVFAPDVSWWFFVELVRDDLIGWFWDGLLWSVSGSCGGEGLVEGFDWRRGDAGDPHGRGRCGGAALGWVMS